MSLATTAKDMLFPPVALQRQQRQELLLIRLEQSHQALTLLTAY